MSNATKTAGKTLELARIMAEAGFPAPLLEVCVDKARENARILRAHGATDAAGYWEGVVCDIGDIQAVMSGKG